MNSAVHCGSCRAAIVARYTHFFMTARRLFLAIYAASGAAALVYEVTWTRLLTLEMGHTVSAVSTVLAAFMGGLAIGAWIAGRIAVRNRLHAYASLEIFVALVALALPFLLAAFAAPLAWAYADGGAAVRFTLMRVTLSLALIAVPAAGMGATFPIAASWFAQASARLTSAGVARSAGDVGALYACNSAGAAAGAIAAGFWLIPAIGLRATTWIGVALNLAAAGGAWWIARGEALAAVDGAPGDVRAGARSKTRRPPSRRPAPPPTASAEPALATAAAALSGFSALVYEVAFTRLLALVIGPTTYAFATMAASFITGIAAGSAVGARLARGASRPGLWLAAALMVTALSASLAASFAASRLPLVVASEVAASNVTFQTVVVRQTFEVALLMLPMTFALGAAFPLALASVGGASVARDTARVYVANTCGAIGGALAAGFVLVPRFGLHATLTGTNRAGLIGAVLLAAAVLLSRANASTRRTGVAAAAIAAIALAMFVDAGRWDRNLLSSGAYKYAPYLNASDPAALEASLRAGRVEYYKEGAAATVSVRRLGGTMSLAIDGKIDASNSGDMLTQRMLGVLPVLLHPDPQDLCVIGLGSGVTVGSAMATGLVHHADVIEISREVVEASAWFSEENGDVLRAPDVRLVVGDGRSHLELSRRKYDVIVSEPSNPWIAGVAALFTQEFFEAARAQLKPDGILCQWAHTYDMSDGDLRSIVRTFASALPESTMWRVGDGDLLLIGTTAANIEGRLDNISERCRRGSVAAMLADVAIDPAAAPFQLLSMFAGGPREIARYGDGAPLQTDDRMALEFTGPRAIYGRSTEANAATIRELTAGAHLPPAVARVMNAADAKSWKARGAMDLRAQAYSAAYASLRRAVALDPHEGDALRLSSEAAAGANRQTEHRAWLESLAATEPANAAVRVELSRVRAGAGDFEGAIAAASDARRLQPGDPRAAEQLASVFADMGDVDRLAPLADALVAQYPQRDDSRYYEATALILRGRAAEAAEAARRILADNPRYTKAQNLLGAACASAGRRDCARAAFEASIRLDPREPSSYVNLGLFYLEGADPARATDYFAEALAIDPTSAAAKDGLRQARAALNTP
jgi:spermidine synthase